VIHAMEIPIHPLPASDEFRRHAYLKRNEAKPVSEAQPVEHVNVWWVYPPRGTRRVYMCVHVVPKK
jgi:hypothetical protein